jgi:hypothetical protein
MCSQPCFEFLDLSVQRRDDVDRSSCGGSEGSGHRIRCCEVFTAQDGLDLGGACLDYVAGQRL